MPIFDRLFLEMILESKKSFHRNKIISLMVVGFLGVFLNFDFSLKYHLCSVDSGEFF